MTEASINSLKLGQNEISERNLTEERQDLAALRLTIDKQQYEINELRVALAREALRTSKRATRIKLAVILLGAIVATSNPVVINVGNWTTIIFSILGITISVLTGIETAFKFEAKARELRILVKICDTTLRKVKFQSEKSFTVFAIAEQLKYAQEAIDFQNLRIEEINERAAELEVNTLIELSLPNQKLST